jgi:hypothetical protein
MVRACECRGFHRCQVPALVGIEKHLDNLSSVGEKWEMPEQQGEACLAAGARPSNC